MSIDAKAADMRAKYEKAQSLIAAGNAQEALPILISADQTDPSRLEIKISLGVCFAILHRMDEAVRAFQAAVKLDPQSAPVHADLCQALIETSKPSEAVDECLRAVRLAPERSRYKQLLASAYLQNGAFSDAISLIEATTVSRNDLFLMGLLGDAYFLQGEYYRAADIYEKIEVEWPAVSIVYLRLSEVYDYLERPGASIAAARKFVELEPKLIYAHLNLGEKFQTFGFIEESIDALNKAVSLDPNNGHAALLLSEDYTILGDQKSALPFLRVAWRQLPHSVPVAHRLGNALMDVGAGAEAVEPLEYANKNQPNTPDFMRSLGLAYITLRRYDDGIALIEKANQLAPLPPNMKMDFSSYKNRDRDLARFDEAVEYVEKNPENVNARRFLAYLYTLKGMTAEAEKQYIELARQHPEDFAMFNQLAIFYSDNNQHDKALEAIRNAVRLKPHHVLYLTLSNELMIAGRLDEAIDAAAHAVEIKPDSLESRLDYGELLLKKGRRDDGLREYQAAFLIASGDPRPNFRLAWLYIKTGNKEGALRHYGILKGIAPNELKWLELSLRAHFGAVAP